MSLPVVMEKLQIDDLGFPKLGMRERQVFIFRSMDL